MYAPVSTILLRFIILTFWSYVSSLPEQNMWTVVLSQSQNATTAHRSLYGNSSVWLVVECESEDNKPLKYSVVLTDSRCITRPRGVAAADNVVTGTRRDGGNVQSLGAKCQPANRESELQEKSREGRVYMTSRDSIVFLSIQLTSSSVKNGKLTARVYIVSPVQGNLSPIDWPLLPFYGTMCCMYAVYAVIWLTLCFCYWHDLLRIQYWIAAVIFLGMLEKAFFVAEYDAVNRTGVSVQGLMVTAELVSCVKRTLARMLFIIVSLGFGIVRPRLGTSLHHVVLVGAVYLVVGSFEGIHRVITHKSDTSLGVVIPAALLTVLDLFISLWIMKSLVDTIRLVALRRNIVKLTLYRHFRNTLIFAVLASFSFMLWSTYQHKLPQCSTWETLWLDEAFWHILFSLLLAVVMFLWRPSANNHRYAYSAAVDEVDEDVCEHLVLSSSQDVKKVRSSQNVDRKSSGTSKHLQDDEALQWVDDNIPSSSTLDITLSGLLDSDDELRDRRYQLSKMQ